MIIDTIFKKIFLIFEYDIYNRFVVGEILAALLSLTALDLSFNDLKPENVIITEAGHIKVPNVFFFQLIRVFILISMGFSLCLYSH